ncbi:type II toxin-antitoxin system RelE/ParE family toxin [Magnetospirillum molischianum]|uniref:Plasmid maintenance system killer n=1 Tax=Magnetospirillum molischianum DSM 120 TaxID=1150626 RepID=H8FNI3_MAGML|nr:type II toxin-antitoxin system RelE/ParE family toxin [Magnetospirillum molischianum]CCG39915.1 Plasmid maintenance system killer [Magnetospirillum molischianum DSM 120]CCG39921.1 Plasmid maintenance system killer [Magnetospirillum molischianum DSM 120]CCG39927.1 Plasmid maintenance system killer [Magnetospirillum molischianum DSM 120]
MITDIVDKGLKDLFLDGTSKHIASNFHRTCIQILDLLNMVQSPKDLVGVKNFHQLKGDRAGYYSMHVNGNWCITFRFHGVDVAGVDFEDYH